MKYNLKYLAEAGYIMGLGTIGEVANHMTSHHDAYFSLEHFDSESYDFDQLVTGHEEESIFKYLTDADKARMDDELEKAMQEGPREEETQGEEENKHF